jgi:hypothetical protein
MIKSVYDNRVVYRNEKGVLHREDGPAIVYNDGTKYFYKNGLLHREDGPAIEYANGDGAYYIYGQMHREDGPAEIIVDGNKEYWIYVGMESSGGHFHAMYDRSARVKYRVVTSCLSLTARQARINWKDNPESLELVEKAIAKFDLIKALIDKE